jgi:hypothetical protein
MTRTAGSGKGMRKPYSACQPDDMKTRPKDALHDFLHFKVVFLIFIGVRSNGRRPGNCG